VNQRKINNKEELMFSLNISIKISELNFIRECLNVHIIFLNVYNMCLLLSQSIVVHLLLSILLGPNTLNIAVMAIKEVAPVRQSASIKDLKIKQTFTRNVE